MYICVMMHEKINTIELQKLYKRDPGAIEHWFNMYVDALYSFIYYKVGMNSELAADLLQETFLEGITKMSQYDPQKASMYVWLTFLSRNHIKKALNAKKQAITHISTNDNESKYSKYCRDLSSQIIPEHIIQTKEIADIVQFALAEIPAHHSEILKLHYYNGNSIKVIAAFLKMTENAAKVLLHRARKSFEKAFIKLAGNLEITDLKVR